MTAMFLRSFFSFQYNLDRFNRLIEELKTSDGLTYPLVQSLMIVFNFMLPQIVIMYSLHQSIKQSIEISKHREHSSSSKRISLHPT